MANWMGAGPRETSHSLIFTRLSGFEFGSIKWLLLSATLLVDYVSSGGETLGKEICHGPVCRYSFHVSWGRTMVYGSPDKQASYNVVLNGTQLRVVPNSYRIGPDPNLGSSVHPDDVHTADGYPRNIVLVNGQFPGPTIQVMEGTQVEVEVYNGLLTESLSIHWHGIWQVDSPWMDGVPYLTQCPVLPRHTFTYKFKAHPPGTHWYHPHLKDQRVDGMYGLLVVHSRMPVIPEFAMVITDWYHVEGKTLATTSPYYIQNPGTGEYEMNPKTSHDLETAAEGEGHHHMERRQKGSHHSNMNHHQMNNENHGMNHDHHDMNNENHDMNLGMDTNDHGMTHENHESGHNRMEAHDVERSKRHAGHEHEEEAESHDGHVDLQHGGHEGHGGHGGHGTSPYGLAYNDLYHISVLVNGRGRSRGNHLPLTTYCVQQGSTYTFRTVNTAAHLPMYVSIDQHYMTIVALDGFEIQPIRVEGFWLHAGESLDFEMKADQQPSSYWIRYLAQHGSHAFHGVATIQYEGNEEAEDDHMRHRRNGEDSHTMDHSSHMEHHGHSDPNSEPRKCTMEEPCVVFNCPGTSYPHHDHKTCIPVDQAKSLSIQDEPRVSATLKNKTPDENIFLNLGMFHGPSINTIHYEPPKVPAHLKALENTCNSTSCQGKCQCTHTLSLPVNKTVQLVLANYDPSDQITIFGHHPVHIHGHSFVILKSGFPTMDHVSGVLTKNPDIQCSNEECSETVNDLNDLDTSGWNMVNPPVKDTVIVPSMGYVVLRFHTHNPGHWLVHCHVDVHSTAGMVLILDVGGDVTPSPPAGMPLCGTQAGQHYMASHQAISLSNGQLTVGLWEGVGIVLGVFFLGILLAILGAVLWTCARKPKVVEVHL